MSLYLTPCKTIPEELIARFTLEGTIPVLDWYLDKNYSKFLNWTNPLIETYLKDNSISNIVMGNGHSPYGKNACTLLLHAFQEYDIKNKKVAVVGSTTPWLEAILLNLGNKVTTVEYNVPITTFPNLSCVDAETFETTCMEYDCIVSYSTIQHCGLGCYGEPLDPEGDLKLMESIHKNLSKNGVLIWSCPVGKDALVWNAQRVYGELRLPMIFEKFKELKWLGCSSKEECFELPLAKYQKNMPIVVLEKKIAF
jgi:hypothetical protein